MNAPQEPNKYPSVGLAYPLAIQSYDWVAKRFEVLDGRIQGVLGLGISLTFATPIALSALDLQYQRGWMVAATVVFLSAICLGTYARLVGHVVIMTPTILYDSWIQYSEEDFKRYSIYYAGKHMKMNASLLARRYRLLSGVILLFVLEALLFGAAVTLFQNASIERTSQDQVRAEAAAESKRAQQILAADPALVSRRLIVPRRCPEHQSAGHHYRLILRSCADATPRHMGRQGGCIPTSFRWRSPSYWKRA